ncbi:Fc.00g109560.m01.CDS01 [Cosmosporella sp. VM-42]
MAIAHGASALSDDASPIPVNPSGDKTSRSCHNCEDNGSFKVTSNFAHHTHREDKRYAEGGQRYFGGKAGVVTEGQHHISRPLTDSKMHIMTTLPRQSD